MERFNRFVGALASVVLLVIFAIILGQVCLRYVFLLPLPWPDEVARALHVWVVFPGAYLVLRRGEHVTVEYFAGFVPPRFRTALDVFVNVTCLIFLVAVIVSGVKAMGKLVDARTVAAGLPMPAILLGTLVGAVLMAVYCVVAACGHLGLVKRKTER